MPYLAAREGSKPVRWEKVIVEASFGTSVEARPEGRFADRDATGHGQLEVVVGGAAHHMRMRFNVLHSVNFLENGRQGL